MTDEELKALVASLAIDQKELTQKMAETEAQIRLNAEQMKLNAEQFKRTDEQFKRTDEQLKRTDEKLERIGINLANIGQNQGDVTEEFFFNSLAHTMRLGKIRFDDLTKSMTKRKGRLEEEYDIVLSNGNAVAVIEVKYKAHSNDLKKLERKLRHFKQLFPVYQSYRLYGGLASFHINDDARREALEGGYFVLQRHGDVIYTESTEHLTVL